MKAKQVEFTPPKDAPLPEGVEVGEDFSVTCDFRLKDNGTICLVRFGEIEMPGYDKTESGYKKQDKPGYGDMAKGMMSMGQDG